jgi:hypothetical protein
VRERRSRARLRALRKSNLPHRSDKGAIASRRTSASWPRAMYSADSRVLRGLAARIESWKPAVAIRWSHAPKFAARWDSNVRGRGCLPIRWSPALRASCPRWDSNPHCGRFKRPSSTSWDTGASVSFSPSGAARAGDSEDLDDRPGKRPVRGGRRETVLDQ